MTEVGKEEWTRRTYLVAPKGFIRWLNVNGHLKTDPGARFRTPRLKRVVSVLPPFDDIEAKLAAERTLRNKAIIAIALYGGLDAQEIQDLKPANFVPIQGLSASSAKWANSGRSRSRTRPSRLSVPVWRRT